MTEGGRRHVGANGVVQQLQGGSVSAAGLSTIGRGFLLLLAQQSRAKLAAPSPDRHRSMCLWEYSVSWRRLGEGEPRWTRVRLQVWATPWC